VIVHQDGPPDLLDEDGRIGQDGRIA